MTTSITIPATAVEVDLTGLAALRPHLRVTAITPSTRDVSRPDIEYTLANGRRVLDRSQGLVGYGRVLLPAEATETEVELDDYRDYPGLDGDHGAELDEALDHARIAVVTAWRAALSTAAPGIGLQLATAAARVPEAT